MSDRLAWLHTQSWAGHLRWPVVVIAETPKRYRVRLVRRSKLPGRERWEDAGTIRLVPKHAVSFDRGPHETHPKGRLP